MHILSSCCSAPILFPSTEKKTGLVREIEIRAVCQRCEKKCESNCKGSKEKK